MIYKTTTLPYLIKKHDIFIQQYIALQRTITTDLNAETKLLKISKSFIHLKLPNQAWREMICKQIFNIKLPEKFESHVCHFECESVKQK